MSVTREEQVATADYSKTKFSKSGEPRMGTTITLSDSEGPFDVKVVGKLYGRGAGMVGVILEEDNGSRTSFEWPLQRQDAEVPR